MEKKQLHPPLTQELDSYWPPVLYMAFSTVLAVLFAGALHIPEPYLTLSSVVTFSFIPTISFQQYCFILVAITTGFFTALLLLTTFPQEPWFYIPLVGVITASGYRFFKERWGIGAAIGFSTYFADPYVSGLYQHFHGNLTALGFHYWVEGFIALTVCVTISQLTQKKPTPAQVKTLSLENSIVFSISVSLATVIVLSTGQAQPGRMLLANISTILAMEYAQTLGSVGIQTLGMLAGFLISLCFITLVAPLGNNFAVYLLALGVTFGTIELLRFHYKSWALFLQIIAQMLALCILMLPQPDHNLRVGVDRALATLLGFFTAATFFIISHALRKSVSFFKKQFS